MRLYRQKLTGFALMVAAALSTGNSAWALEDGDCLHPLDRSGPHAWEGDYEDVGSSLVLFQTSFCYEGCNGVVTLVHCRSGKELSVRAMESRTDIDFDRTEEAYTILRQMIGAQESYQFQDVSERLTQAGFSTHVSSESDEEACVCGAFYPEHRGTKTAYVEWNFSDDDSDESEVR